jgi:2-aminophenol/2-amino-5-chlorophenol 1,6-dioxygenase alpha subunit
MSERAPSNVVAGFVVSGLPQILLCPEQNPGWMRVRQAYEAAREAIVASGAERIVVYSTMWPSVIGHQIVSRPEPTWVHVDELFHDIGSIPYTFKIDTDFAHDWCERAHARQLSCRTVDYHGFPIDTGSVVALKLLNPDNRIPAVICSSNVYADRAETVVFGKACRDAIDASDKKVAVVVVMSLSNRFFTDWIDPKDDRIHSQKDEEWNQKLLEFLGEGRLEDTAQLSRQIQQQIRVHKVVNFKSLWWMAATMGQHNNYIGKVHGYAPIHGAGAAVVQLTPSPESVGDKEFDEDDVERFGGDREVLDA